MKKTVLALILATVCSAHSQSSEKAHYKSASSLSSDSQLGESRPSVKSSSSILQELALTKFRQTKIQSLGGVDAGGGDFIRSTFLKAATKIQRFLHETEAGQKISKDAGLSDEVLKRALDVNRIVVVEESLIDRTGSLVDAVFKEEVLYLNRERWTELFTEKREASVMVGHELFRLAKYDDENYVISKNLQNLPGAYTQVSPSYLSGDLASELQSKKAFSFGTPVHAGDGCSATGDFSFEATKDQTFTFFSNHYSALAGSASQKRIDRASCSVAIPFSVKPGYRLVVTQIDFYGHAIGDNNQGLKLDAEIFVAGSRGPRFNHKATSSGTFLLRETVNLKTNCGESSNLRINSSVSAQATEKMENAGLRMNRSKFYFTVEKCD